MPARLLIVEFESKTMPIFNRQEVEALLDKYRELSNVEPHRVNGGETCSVGAEGTAWRPKSFGALCARDDSGMVAETKQARQQKLGDFPPMRGGRATAQVHGSAVVGIRVAPARHWVLSGRLVWP
ncbi:MAG: hypothetical protein ACLPID_13630 [Beijerinckiaceae bacterium]